jgi:putative GTP pyrophosphokinase
MTLEEFQAKNRISQETWEKSNCEWALLEAIASDHQENHDLLRETAEAFARIIQKFEAVHSVRWRVKDTEHLLEKIVRKRASGAEKYSNISVQNYRGIVTDLVGIRALHLFPGGHPNSSGCGHFKLLHSRVRARQFVAAGRTV